MLILWSIPASGEGNVTFNATPNPFLQNKMFKSSIHDSINTNFSKIIKSSRLWWRSFKYFIHLIPSISFFDYDLSSTHVHIIQICSGITCGRVLNGELYAQRFQNSKMLTVRNARSLVTSRELLSGLQIWGKSPLNALFSMDADTDSASEEGVKVIQGHIAHGTLYVRLTCPTMDNRHNKLSQVPEF